MEKYPFVKCLQPKSIINPYTGEHLVVPCGSCPACSLRKSSVNAMKCKMESLSHKYTMFITLTYNNISLPRMQLRALNRQKDDCGEVFDTGEPFSLVDITQRLGTQGTILGNTMSYDFIRETLSKKVNLPKGILPHLSKYDGQLFIKRLRRYLDRLIHSKYGKEAEKIRYYLVGEYGPVHFRPHYHVILWFSQDETYSTIREVIHKSWQFGRVDVQKSLGKCADYVAKYLNSSVSLPEVFKLQQTKPFSIHSAYLGEKVLALPRKEIYENEFERVISRSLPSIDTSSDVFLWRSLKAYYFPKCKGYASKSEYERLYSYSTYVETFRWTQEARVSEQARIILDHILRRHFHHDVPCDNFGLIRYDLVDYFTKSACIDYNLLECDQLQFSYEVENAYKRIYMELRISKHFHHYVCDGVVSDYELYIRKIHEFWMKNDLMNLNNQYRIMEEFGISEWFENEEDYQFFYHNRGFLNEQYKQSKAYKCLSMVTRRNAENSVKHKELNDLNKVFENK